MNQSFSYSLAKKKFSLFLLAVFCLETQVSCRQQVSETNKYRFIATVDLISYNNNAFQIFYKKQTDDRYYEELSVKKNASGSNSSQRLIFEFPEGIKPKNIRFDLGESENDSVRLENITFQYKDRTVKGDNGVYKSWFVFNQNVIPGKDTLTYHLKRVNGFFDPQLNGNQVLNARLAKLFPPDIYEF